MEHFWGTDSVLFRVLEKSADFVILNLLWAVFCIPIVTIGTSTTALYYVTFKMCRNEDSHVAKMFFQSFWMNLKQGSILTIFFIVAGLILYIDTRYLLSLENGIKVIALGIFVGILLAALVIGAYTFPLLAQFDNTVMNTLKNAFMIGMANLPCTIAVIVLNAIPIMIGVFFPYIFYAMLPFWLLFGIVLIAFLNSKMLKGVFEKYM